MNDEPHKDRSDDLLSRAIGAMNDEANRSELPQRTIADTLAALRKAGAKQSPGIWKRVIVMTTTHKIAAAIGLTVGALVLYFALSLFSSFSSVSYADVAAKIRDAKSMTFKIKGLPTGAANATTIEAMWMEPGHFRMQMTPDMALVEDAGANRAIMLNSKTKTATTIDVDVTGPAAQRHRVTDYVEYFKQLADAKGEPTGEAEIGGVKAKKFRAKLHQFDAIVYADAKSGQLLKIELSKFPGAAHMEMTDFNFDAKLDPQLFSLAIPDGFTVSKEFLHISGTLEDNLPPVLKAYAEYSGGRFPKDLRNWADIFTTIVGKTKPTTLPAEMKDTMSRAGAITGIMMQYEKGKTYDYFPESVKLGEADKILFWFKPKDSKTYKAIYGDLHVAEVTAEQLPKK